MQHDCFWETFNCITFLLSAWKGCLNRTVQLFQAGFWDEEIPLGFLDGAVVKNPPASAADARDRGSIPGLERSPGKGNGNLLEHSCWRIPWTEEPGGLQSMGSQRVEHDWVTEDALMQGSHEAGFSFWSETWQQNSLICIVRGRKASFLCLNTMLILFDLLDFLVSSTMEYIHLE